MSTPPVSTPPSRFKYRLDVELEFAVGQLTSPSVALIASDTQSAIAADETIAAQNVHVEVFVPAGSGE